MGKRKGFGLVLAGGGGKGAYEIGVWKALREAGDIEIGAVSGSSVGALNAALFAAGDYDKAEDIWLHIQEDKILTPAEYSPEEYLAKWLCKYGKILLMPNILMTRKYLTRYNGIFSRQGLIEIIQDSGIAGKLCSAKIPCYATCYNLTEIRSQYFLLNDLPPEKVVSVLLASSAIPFLFPKEYIDSAAYCDGGLTENVPVRPLYEAGWRDFIVIHLERSGIEKFSGYQGCEFIHIYPKDYQGGILGTLDFHPESAKMRLDQGYKDMKTQLCMIKNLDGKLEKRERTFEKMHAKASGYDRAMEKAGILPEDSEDQLESVYQRLTRNKSTMNDFMLKAVAAMTAADAQLDERHRKKVLGDLFGEMSGKNRRLQHGIDKLQINSQRDMIRMVARLAESDVLSMELMQCLQSQIYGSACQMAKVLQSHGKEIDGLNFDLEKISKAYHELAGQDREIAEEIDRIYGLIRDRSEKNDERFRDVNAEIEGMKDVQSLQNWRLNLKFRQFSGTDYRDLDMVGKVICTVSDFFSLTDGAWNDEMLLFVKSGLDELGVDPHERLSCKDVIYKLVNERRYAEYLFARNGIQYIWEEQESEVTPPCETLIQGTCIGDRLADVLGKVTEQQIGRYLEAHHVSNEPYLSAFDIACMLLVTLSKYHVCGDERKDLKGYREIEKRALLGDVDAMEKYAGILLENHYDEEAFRYMALMEEGVKGDS